MIKVKTKIRERDLGWDRIKRQVKALGTNPHVVVGVRGESALAMKEYTAMDGSKKTSVSARLVDIAIFHEYGVESKNIPERSFLRAVTKANAAKYRRFIVKAWNQMLVEGDKMPVEKVLALLGEMIRADVQAYMRSGINPPWAESTLENRYQRSGGIVAITPLIDTGQLINSISYEVRKGGQKT